jgi:beta-lactamase class A
VTAWNGLEALLTSSFDGNHVFDREVSLSCYWSRIAVSTVLVLSVHRAAPAQDRSLREELAKIAAGVQGRVGVAVVGIESGDTLTIDGSGRYPMQSVYKFPVALSVLQRVDKGTLSLEQKLHITKADLLPGTWSPLRDKYPEGDVDVSLDEILRYTVSLSDNNCCDILFRLLGGTQVVQDDLRGIGITGIDIVATEEEMHAEWRAQYRNWSTPAAMGQLLRKFYRGEILSDGSTSYLRRIMEETTTGLKRIKGLLPKGTVVAHKTGSSGADERGFIAATNDVGVVRRPGGEHLAIAVFVADATFDQDACEETIARIAKAVWDRHARGKL